MGGLVDREACMGPGPPPWGLGAGRGVWGEAGARSVRANAAAAMGPGAVRKGSLGGGPGGGINWVVDTQILSKAPTLPAKAASE